MLNKKFQHGNTFLPYLILVVIAGLVTTNLWLYFWNQKEITPSQPQSVVTTTDPLAGWQTYTNGQYGFNIKYPSNWVAKEIPNQEYGGVVNFFQSGSKTYPEQGGSQPIGENLVTLSLLKNPNDLTLQQIFNNNYNKCLQEPNNDFGCPSPQNTESWQTITVDGAKAWRTGDTGIPEGPGADTLYIKQDGYYIEMTLMLFEPVRKNIDTAILDRMISTFRFTDDMSDWKIYKNEKLHYQIQLPTGWWINEQKDFTQILPPSIEKEVLPSGAGFGGAQSDQPIITISRVVDLELGETMHNIQDERKITIDSIESSQRQENGSFGNSINTYIPLGKNYIKFSWDLISKPSDPALEQILSTFKFIK